MSLSVDASSLMSIFSCQETIREKSSYGTSVLLSAFFKQKSKLVPSVALDLTLHTVTLFQVVRMVPLLSTMSGKELNRNRNYMQFRTVSIRNLMAYK